MKVALVQMPIVWENKDANFSVVREMLAGITFPRGPGLVVLPELFATGFSMDSEAISEDDFGQTESFLIELAKAKATHVIGGIAKKGTLGVKPFNCAVIVSADGEILCRYQKTYPFSYGYEDANYSSGQKIETVSLSDMVVCPSICYDLRFPELFRIGARLGAEIYVVIANWPEKRNQHWRTLLQARAIENQAYVIGVNRCGEDPTLQYSGSTLVVNYLGEIVADAGSEPGVIEADLDLAGLREWRETFPALKDIRDSLSS